MLAGLGRPRETEQHYQAVLKVMRHPVILRNYADFLRQAGRAKEAAVLEEAAALEEEAGMKEGNQP